MPVVLPSSFQANYPDTNYTGSLKIHHLVECETDCAVRFSVHQGRVSPGLLTPVILTKSTRQFPFLALTLNSSCQLGHLLTTALLWFEWLSLLWCPPCVVSWKVQCPQLPCPLPEPPVADTHSLVSTKQPPVWPHGARPTTWLSVPVAALTSSHSLCLSPEQSH